MDLIYTNASKKDIGVLEGYSFDLAYGKDENNFECVVSSDNHVCESGSLLYIDGTEYGGIVDEIGVDTAAEDVKYLGRTWHGILASKVIVPLKSGETSTADVTLKTTEGGTSLVNSYLVVSGDANAIIAWLVERIGLTDIFAVSGDAIRNISNFRFDRYTDAYSGIKKMLKSAGLKLKMSYSSKERRMVLYAEPTVNYSAEDVSSDLFDFTASKKYRSVNHLICLGKGELADRMVRHLYVDVYGNISTTQTQFGDNEYTEVFDYSNAESEEELIENGKERLAELWQPDDISISVLADTFDYDIGDTIQANDPITKLTITAVIGKKIVNIANDITTIQYEVEE